ncbi:hypothetical protein BC830DRAFT_73396 [Chytriomyces sp. MP71]|nr:hypothetical protein BC830DRAFT_73396 [Chytriomyces sp. MP71]
MSSGASPFTATDAVVAAIVINALVVLSTGKRGLHASSSGERQSLLGSSVATSTSHGHAGPAPLSRAASFTLALSVLCQAAAALFSFLSPTVSTGFVASACIVASSGLFVAMRVLISSESSVSTFAELSFALVSATYHLLFLLSATTNYPASVLVAHMGALGLLLTVVGISLCQGFTLQAEIIENQNEQLKKNGAALPSPEPLKFRFDNLFSILFFTWQSPLMRLGSSRPLTMEDLPELSEPEKAHVAVAKYAAYK